MSLETSSPLPSAPPETTRRRRRWIFLGCVSVVFLVLLLTPPLVSVNRLQRRIASSMSASLGRPVHLDRATLHLLPVPGFTLENLVVSEDPAFGTEPAIRANTVEATLRPSTLWTRRVEFASIRFQEPSLNLVRNAAGEWNLQSLLMHAAQVEVGPTAQAKAGPAPRFPYVEATGGRINLKLGDEKTPFSLTDADFALWLPAPDEWRLRLVGKPMRTDRNVADTGTLRIEGSLRRAAHMAEVPVDLRASWRSLPLGEASKLALGDDAGWRGTLNVEAALAGPLGAAHLNVNAHVRELRRADFVPALELQLDAECNATLQASDAVLHDTTCALDTPAAAGNETPGRIVAIADTVEPVRRAGDGLRIGMTNVPNTWLLDWARLFSQRIPPAARPGGVAAGSVVYAGPAGWSGAFHSSVFGRLPEDAADANSLAHPVSVVVADTVLTVQPVNLAAQGLAPLLLSGEVASTGYTVRLAGTAAPAEVEALRSLMPPLGDGLDAVFASLGDAPQKPEKISLTCSRRWNEAALCSTGAPDLQRPTHRRKH